MHEGGSLFSPLNQTGSQNLDSCPQWGEMNRTGSISCSNTRILVGRVALCSLLLLLLAGAFTRAQAAGIALVQHIGKDAGTTTTSTLAFPSANTAGNFIAIVIRGGLSNSQVFTVKDSNANIYKQANQIGSSGSAVTSAIYYAENIVGGAISKSSS